MLEIDVADIVFRVSGFDCRASNVLGNLQNIMVVKTLKPDTSPQHLWFQLDATTTQSVLEIGVTDITAHVSGFDCRAGNN